MFFDVDGKVLSKVVIGVMLDMVGFMFDGNYVVVVNEGEFNDVYMNDLEGSVFIVDIFGDIESLSGVNVKMVDFKVYDGKDFFDGVKVGKLD